jgi:predicted aldo/keto reductase-like oxidoreductase
MQRREFLKGSAMFGAANLVRGGMGMAQTGSTAPAAANRGEAVPHRPLGKTGVQVSAIGVGGYHLGSVRNQNDVNQLVAEAMDAGINFFDNAWEYHDGQSEVMLGNALQGRRQQAVIMSKVCTHGRDKNVAMRQLEESLRRLKTEYLDIWQIHEVIYYNDPELIFAPNGAAEALAQAKREGKVRFVGFTGHKDPAIHLRMLTHGFPFDTVQMPLNCLDANFRSFEQQVLPEAQRRGVAVLGMKSLSGSGEMVHWGAITAHDALRYAMSLPVVTTISGMDALWVLHQNLEVARGFQPMSPQELSALRDRVKFWAADGRYELFKTTKKYDGPIGRQQHHYPTPEQLPA